MNILDFIRPTENKVNPDSVAVIQNDKEITYNEINSSVEKTSFFLKNVGIKENDIITLLSNNSLEFIVTVLSLWEIGAVPVPLNVKFLKKNLDEQIEFLNSGCTIKSKEFLNFSAPGKNLFIPFDDLLRKAILPGNKEKKGQRNFSNLLSRQTEEKTALILFTSGSSGKPKAVMLSFENLIQNALTGNKVLNQTKEDKWLASLPFYHIGGFSIIFRALMFGASIVIPTSLSNDDLLGSIKKHQPTLASLVSNQLKKFVKENFIPNIELRTVLLGGGFSDKDLILKAIKKGWKIAKVYGSTETSSFISFMNYEEMKKKPQASGRVISPNKIKITDTGEIAVQSQSVMQGYFNNKEGTEEKIKNGFYYTGDSGHLDNEGYLYVEAKRTDLIISGGENINPFEVENEISSHSKVKEVSVVGIEDKEWGQIVSAAVVLKENKKLTENELKNFLRNKLASFKIPKQIVFINDLPKTELGKIFREEVKKLFNKE
ncbi:MAG: o-succinylbenzoate--CoA ligase [Ignavibacteria bacterium RBG_16_34_14]|nr:MAG: o-succinylbenzoate--CoA ligase [Ignavibacteria bacterium RBG_16_34_14]